MSDERTRKEFEELARPIMKFINDNWPPHTKIIIGSTSGEIMTKNGNEMSIYIDESVKD